MSAPADAMHPKVRDGFQAAGHCGPLADGFTRRTRQILGLIIAEAWEANDRNLGYGGASEAAARVTKASGGEGIDSVIHEHRFGMDVIDAQAKKGWLPPWMPVQKAGEILGETDQKLWRALFAHVAAAWRDLSWENVVRVGGRRNEPQEGP